MSEKKYPTPHINARPEDFAKTVIMPGDPQRAKRIAENFLDNASLVNDVRGMLAFTGTYKGTPVSVMGSGMGMPSIGIYSYELFNIFGVENIIRTGTCGGMQEFIDVGDIVLAMGASTNSSFANQYNLNGTYSAIAGYNLLKNAAECCDKNNMKYYVGNVLSSDVFYSDSSCWNKLGILGVEMEAAALYMNAAASGKNALTILTVSDLLFSDKKMTADQRLSSVDKMLEIALETAIKAGE